jgi:hypothetical protein
MVGRFWRPYIGQAVVGKLALMVLIGGAEERADIQQDNFHHRRGSFVKVEIVHGTSAAKT